MKMKLYAGRTDSAENHEVYCTKCGKNFVLREYVYLADCDGISYVVCYGCGEEIGKHKRLDKEK